MSAFQNIPAPSGRPEVLVVEVSTFASDVRAKLKEDAQSICERNKETEPNAKILYVECSTGKRQKQLEDAEQDGCFSELFIVSTRARELGWSRFLVADNLTKRQTNGDLASLRTWERAPEATVVSISIGSPISEAPVAKRLPLSIAIKSFCGGEDKTESENNENSEMEQFESGISIHDPDGRLFTAATRSTKVEQTKMADELTYSAGIPLEISTMISDYAHEEPAVKDMIDTQRDEDTDKTFRLQAITPATDSIIEAAQSALTDLLSDNGGNRDTECKILPWKLTGAATRRNIYRLYERILNGESKAMLDDYRSEYLFWDVNLWSDGPRPKIIFMSHRDDRIHVSAVDAQEPLHLKALEDRERWFREHTQRLYKEESQCREEQSELRTKIDDDCIEKEILQDPGQRFFYDPPSWAPSGHNGLPVVYFLTKHLSDDDIRRIKHELIYERNEADDSYDEGPKEYEFVSWVNEDDGTAEDMARIHKKCFSRKWRCPGQQIFIDKQSTQDLTVVLADTWFSKKAMRHLGIQFGRLAGRDAHIAYINLEIANTDITDHVDEGEDINLFKNPDNPESDSESSAPSGDGEDDEKNDEDDEKNWEDDEEDDGDDEEDDGDDEEDDDG